MLASFLMGLVGGQRALTPLAAVAVASARGGLAVRGGPLGILAHPAVAAGAVALAAAEMVGDKAKNAPDRIIPIGLFGRAVSSAVAGAALTSGRSRWAGAAIGGSTAVAASYVGWRLRCAAVPRFGQTASGLVEDAIVAAGAGLIVARGRPTR